MIPSLRLPPTPAVAEVTVSFADVLEGFLHSVPASSTEPLGVVVAANRTEDVEAKPLASAASVIHLSLVHHYHYHYGGAINVAVRTLPDSVELVLVSDPDVVLESGTIDTLVAKGGTNESIGAVYPSTRPVPASVTPC